MGKRKMKSGKQKDAESEESINGQFHGDLRLMVKILNENGYQYNTKWEWFSTK